MQLGLLSELGKKNPPTCINSVENVNFDVFGAFPFPPQMGRLKYSGDGKWLGVRRSLSLYLNSLPTKYKPPMMVLKC